ncbi:hypothetical protein PInf_022345 [Phytophthora infestans]|nr:hypothetical protein PInf_022345 [Phytophthora infestans]
MDGQGTVTGKLVGLYDKLVKNPTLKCKMSRCALDAEELTAAAASAEDDGNDEDDDGNLLEEEVEDVVQEDKEDEEEPAAEATKTPG